MAENDIVRERTIQDWTPGKQTVIAMNVAGVVLSVAGFIGFMAAYTFTHPKAGEVKLFGRELLLTLLITAVIIVLHELVHGAAASVFGAKPTYSAGLLYKFMPYLATTAEGHWFTKQQFVVVALAPMFLITLVMLPAVIYAPYGGWLVLPMAMHTGGCIGDLWMTAIVAKTPQASLIEDRSTGLRIALPAK